MVETRLPGRTASTSRGNSGVGAGLIRCAASGLSGIAGGESMKFSCPHCYSNTFRLLVDADGTSLAQCLYCGETSSFTVGSILDASGRARFAETVPAQYAPRIPR